jgi:fructosamine-3-kinase
MTRLSAVAGRAELILGMSVVATSPVAGGDVSTCTRLRLGDGSTALIKTHPAAPDGFFAAEARGLTQLANAVAADEVGGLFIPELLGHDHDCLILRWVESGKPSVDVAASFGRALARLHSADAGTTWGGVVDGFIGLLPMPNTPATDWPDFFITRRVLPYLKYARDRGAVSPEGAELIEQAAKRTAEIVPDDKPALLHGDLWNGNVLWRLEGGIALIDPATYAGHREVDLAMLTLFGLPQLPRVLGAYVETAPLADGWEDRLPFHQLFPLLAHACAFGAAYGNRATEVARRFV